MSDDFQLAPVIFAGYAYSIRIEAENALFPVGAEFLAHVRARRNDATILATLTSSAGLSRVSDTALDITVPGAATANLTGGSVFLDLVRTDVDPDAHLQFILEIPVELPVTRGGDA